MSIWQDLNQRKLVFQHSSPDLEAVLEKSIRFYCGFDPTADSLHVGHLLPIIQMDRLMSHGHQAIALIGGATALIGDPSGKSTERPLLSDVDAKINTDKITSQIKKILPKAFIVNNAEWMRRTMVTDWLRDVGKHFSVNAMLARDAVKNRLTDGISFTEFAYALVQANDFLHLFRNYDCKLQIGGSDQWGNIISGIDLIRKNGGEAFGLTFPLLLKSDGTKFGKSEGNTVWLDPSLTSPFEFYQFFVRAEDSFAWTLLAQFTQMSVAEIGVIDSENVKHPETRLAQKIAAKLITTFVHGEREANEAEKTSECLYGEDIKHLSVEKIRRALNSAPTLTIRRSSIGTLKISELVSMCLEISKSLARHHVESGALSVNNIKIMDKEAILTKEHLIDNELVVLRKGKKTYHLVRILEG